MLLEDVKLQTLVNVIMGKGFEVIARKAWQTLQHNCKLPAVREKATFCLDVLLHVTNVLFVVFNSVLKKMLQKS